MGILTSIQLFFPIKNWGSKEEIWEEEIIEEEAVFIEGLGYVFKEDIPGKDKESIDESEFCYLIDRLRDVHECICKNGGVQQIGRKLDPVTREPECVSVQIDVPDDHPYKSTAMAMRSKVRQVSPGKLHDLSPYCK